MKKNVTIFLSLTIAISIFISTTFSEKKQTREKVKHNFPVLQKGAGNNIVSGNYFIERFEGSAFPPAGWSVQNPDEDITWTLTNQVSSFGIGAGSVWMECYNYGNFPQFDTIKTPVISGLVGGLGDSIKFDIAYAKSNLGAETLKVLLSTNGGNSFSTVLFNKGGDALKSTTSNDEFIPNPTQWKTFSAGLPVTVAGNNCVFAFVSRNDFANNLYLDNVRIGTVPTNDALVGPVTISSTQAVIGNTIPVSVKVTWLTNNTPPVSVQLTYKEGSAPVSSGDGVTEVFVPFWSGSPKSFTRTFQTQFVPTHTGVNTIFVRAFIGIDGDSTNNIDSRSFGVTHIITEFPFFENFDNNSDSGWFSGSSSINNDWIKGTPHKALQIFSSYSSPYCWVTRDTGNYNDYQNSYLVSPVFDFSSLLEDPVLDFYHNFRFEANVDGAVVEYDVNGTGFTTLGDFGDTTTYNWYNNANDLDSIIGANFSGSSTNIAGHDSGWINSRINLHGFAGIGKVQFRFRIGADYSGGDDGWAIDNVRIHFGFIPATISGKKFNDINSNGAYDNGEPGIPNWTISLQGAALVNKQTDANGDFKFTGLQAGNYIISEFPRNGWIQTMPGGNGTYSVTLDTGETETDKNFGNFELGSLSGTVFYDGNSNGIRDEEESAMNGWQIHIAGPNTDTVLSSANGNYSLSNLRQGLYTLTEIMQNGYDNSIPTGVDTTIVINSGDDKIINFGNFLITSLSVKMLEDEDGIFSTPFDRSNKRWHLKIYSNSVSPQNLLAETVDTLLYFERNEGIYIIAHAESTKWTSIGKLRNALPLQGNYLYDTISVAGGTANSAYFVSFLPNTIILRNEEDNDGSFIATSLDRTPKQWSLRLFASTGLSAIDTTIMDSILNVSNLPRGTYVAEISDSIEWTHLGIVKQGAGTRTKSTTDTISIADGIDGRITFVQWRQKPDSLKYRTFIQTQLTPKSTKLKPSKKIPFPIPNYGNVRDSAFEQGVPKGTSLLFGIQRIDSAKKYGWVTFKGGKGGGAKILKALPQTAVADSFKHKKEMKSPTVKKLNNKLAGELITLRINIIASNVGITTPDSIDQKFGALIYERSEDSLTPYYGLTINEISFLADTALTYGKNIPTIDFVKLANILELLNSSFHSEDTLAMRDTISLFYGGIKLKGYKMVKDVPYLRRDLGIPPRIYFPVVSSNIPEEFSLRQNYPNPFNPTTTLSFTLTDNTVVSLKIYNILGEEVQTLLHDEVMDEGVHEISFDASGLSSGVYFYRLFVENKEQTHASFTKKMLLIK